MDLAKPAKGTAKRAKTARRRRITEAETAAKLAAKARDIFCRVFGCPRLGVEAAHIRSKGMGGDHGLRSSDPSDYVALCSDHHQGPRSVHSGHIAIVCLTAQRGDGPVEFRDQQPGDRHAY